MQKVSEEMSDAHESQATDTVTERIPVLGVRFDALTMPTLIERLDREVARGERFRIAFANPEFVMESRKSAFLRRYLAMTRYTLADGIGIVWAARRSGGRLPQRVTGTDFTERLAELCSRRGYSLFLLGGKPGVAEEARARLLSAHPGLRVVGSMDGYFDNDESVVDAINQARPTFLMVCLGNPMQEDWIEKHFDRLDVQVAFGNGGALDFCSGRVARAPQWMMRFSLEWLHRLSRDFTWRRIRRQTRLVGFVALVLARQLSATGKTISRVSE